MKRVKWAVWGSCGIARRRTIPEGIKKASNARLKAIYDVADDANRALAAELKVRPAASAADLLGKDVQAVYIATPAYLHYEQVLTCIQAGKHVLCEKPLGMDNRQAEEMVAAARGKGVQLGCAFMMRFQSQHQAALQMIREGKLGKLTYARAQLSCWYPPMAGNWRQSLTQGGGGSLIDMGGHCIDLLEMLVGEIAKVSCFTVDTFFNIPDVASKNALELYGSGGSILATGTIGQGKVGKMTAFLSDPNAAYDAQQARSAAKGLVAIKPKPVNMYRAEIEAFSQTILDGRPGPLDAVIGLRSQKILSACYQSARSGQVVDVL
jgi:predicted dehydrogenase